MSEIGVGASVAGLRLDEVVSESPTVVVYRATDPSTGEHKAVKVLRGADASIISRLRGEAVLLAHLDHPNVVPFEGLFEQGDDVMLVTAWVDGQTLGDLHQGETISAAEARTLINAVAEPLEHLHHSGIVHGTIRPSNILQSSAGDVTLIDLCNGHIETDTSTYLAPEVVRGERPTSRSDQYSLAAVMYSLIAGRPPFPEPELPARLRLHQIHTAPEPLDTVDPAVPSRLARAIERALHKNPSQRFATMTEFAAAASSTGAASTSTTATTVTRPRRRKGPPLAAAAAAVAIAAVAAVLLWPARAGSPGDELASDEVLAVMAEPGATATEILVLPEPSPDQQPPDEVLAAPAPPLSADDLGDDLGDSLTTAGAGNGAVATAWTSGSAASLGCNQLRGSSFSTDAVPIDYYMDTAGRSRVDQGGFEDSSALQVGLANVQGQFGELVPVTPGISYWFRGWFERQGDVDVATMGVALLDANNQLLDIEINAPAGQAQPGFSELQFANVPPQAAFALPYLFKDTSPGVLIADELVFGEVGACFAQLTAGGS